LLSNAILEVCEYATKGELLLHIVAGLLEGIVVELPTVAVVEQYSNAVHGSVLLKSKLGGNCFL
jgi:hypothetical protein